MQIFKSFWRFLWPKASDLPVVSICLFLLVAIAIPELLQLPHGRNSRFEQLTISDLLVRLSPLTVFAIAIGATLGVFNRAQLRENRWWFIAILAIFFGVAVLLRWQSLLQFRATTPSLAIPGLPTVWLLQVVIFLVAWLSTRLCFIWRGMSHRMARPMEGRQINRTRVLICFMIVMYLIYLATNLLPKQSGTTEFQLSLDNSWIWLLAGLVGVFVLSSVPALIAESFKTPIGLLVLAVFFVIVATIALGIFSFESLYFVIPLSLITIGMLISGKWYRNLPSNTARPLIGSLWSLGLVGITITIFVAAMRYDLTTLIASGMTDLQTARIIRQLKTQRGVEARCASTWELRASGIEGEIILQPTAAPNCFASLNGYANPVFFGLTRLTPEIETRYFQNLSKNFVWLTDSVVSIEQIGDLANGTRYLNLENVRFVESTASVERPIFTASSRIIFCAKFQPGEASKLLAKIDEKSFKGRFRFTDCSPFSSEDWQQIFWKSQFFPITIDQSPTPDVVEIVLSDNLSRSLTVNGEALGIGEIFRLAIDSSLAIELSRSTVDDRVFWEILFASSGSTWNFGFRGKVTEMADGLDRDAYLAFIKSTHLLFDIDESDSPRGLWMPWNGASMIPKISEFTELEILSFDSDWLPSLQTQAHFRPQISDLTDLGQLIKLKRLEFSDVVCPADLSFLQTMPDLEYLRLDVSFNGVREVDCGFEAKFCPQLKTLVIAGRPTKALALEIAKLANLKSLTVVELEGVNSLTAEQREEFEALIGSRISPIYVLGSEYEPTPPPEFMAHRQRVIQQLREKYLKE